MKPVDERKNMEEQVLQNLLFEIGRGAYKPGDALPPPEKLAQKLVMNPNRVVSAYAVLVEENIARQEEEGVFIIQDGAEEKIRLNLLERFRENFETMYSLYRKAGCPAEDMNRLVKARLERTEKGEKPDHG
jgi:DNA-binding transcriptional regulator YhcF (GntR family)